MVVDCSRSLAFKYFKKQTFANTKACWRHGLLAGVDGVGDVDGGHGVGKATDTYDEGAVSGPVVDDPPPVLFAVAEHDEVTRTDTGLR